MNFQIREANIDDAESIAQFQIAMALETEDKTLDPNVVLPAVKKVFGDSTKGFYLVAANEDPKDSEQPNSVIGSLLVTFEWSDWRDSFIWYIQSVYVDKDFRGHGVFRNLYARVMELATEQDVMFVRLYVETENHRAQKIYESLGMKRMPYYMYDVRVGD